MKVARFVALAVYYSVGSRFPTQPVPGWRIGYWLRRRLARVLFAECGSNVIVKKDCYFGTGSTLRVGNDSQLGANARIDHDVVIGNDVIMGPDVVIMTGGHAFEASDVLIRDQGAAERMPVHIGDDVWIGTRAVIMPGVTIGDGTVIGANSVVTHDIPPMSVAAGVPCSALRARGSRASNDSTNRLVDER